MEQELKSQPFPANSKVYVLLKWSWGMVRTGQKVEDSVLTGVGHADHQQAMWVWLTFSGISLIPILNETGIGGWTTYWGQDRRAGEAISTSSTREERSRSMVWVMHPLLSSWQGHDDTGKHWNTTILLSTSDVPQLLFLRMCVLMRMLVCIWSYGASTVLASSVSVTFALNLAFVASEPRTSWNSQTFKI